jgi:hypothetical protein
MDTLIRLFIILAVILFVGMAYADKHPAKLQREKPVVVKKVDVEKVFGVKLPEGSK